MSDSKCPVHQNGLEPVKNFIRPDKPHGCTYERSFETHEASPHHHVVRYLLIYFINLYELLNINNKNFSKPRNTDDICKNALSIIGNTPLIKLENLSNDYEIKCNLCK